MMVIDKELEHLKKNLAESFSDPCAENDILDFVLGPSKRIRSVLTILYLKALGCEINNNTFKILVAGELIHNASLFHDDVIDNAEKRRNETVFAKKYSPKVSILAGDFLLTIAIKNLLSLNNEHIFLLFQNCTQKMVEAELKQYFLRGNFTSYEEYAQISCNKTSLLFATILEASAIQNNLDVDQAKRIGILFGDAFQLKNDTIPDSRNLDMNNGICTVVDILGIENSKNLLDNYKKELLLIMDKIPKNIYRLELEGLINSL